MIEEKLIKQSHAYFRHRVLGKLLFSYEARYYLPLDTVGKISIYWYVWHSCNLPVMIMEI